MKKGIIIIGIIVIYLGIGLFVFRDTVDTEIGFSEAYINDLHVVAGKNLEGSYHYAEVVAYRDNVEVFRYTANYQNSLYRDIFVDNNTIYLVGYSFTKDSIVKQMFVTKLSNELTLLEEETFESNGEIYPKSILAKDNYIYVISSFSGNRINDQEIHHSGEYDILVMMLDEHLQVDSMVSYGMELSELVSDALILNNDIYISYNYFDSLVTGNVEEHSNGAVIRFRLLDHVFSSEYTLSNQLNNRIQGLIVEGEQVYFFGNIVDEETNLLTPCFGEISSNDITMITDLETNANIYDGVIIDDMFVFVLQMEHFQYSETFGDITRKMIAKVDDTSTELIAIDDDVYIHEINNYNNRISVIGYQVSNHFIKADTTIYYYEQIDFDMTESE